MSLDNTVNVFILYGCTLSKERSSMRIVAATTDEEMLHTIIGAQILGGYTLDCSGNPAPETSAPAVDVGKYLK